MDNYNNYYQGGEQNPYNPPVQEQKSSNKIWLWILIPVLIIIIGVVVFYFFNSSATKISDNEFSQGTNLQIKQDNEAKFIIDDEEHTIKVNSVSGDSVNLIIQSDPIQVDIKIGETKKFDLNNDGFYDIQVKLNGIEDGVPEIYIKKIHESTCSENWNCSEWSSCSEQGIQTRSCTDLNDCGTTKNKPATTQSCTYTCVEDWSCTNWSSCTSGQQTRTCTDSNSCETTKDKPTEQQSCTSQIIDCGSNTQSQETIGNQPNFDCFVDASENCEPSKLLNTVSVEIFGMLGTSTAYMELKGLEAGKCVYYQRTESNSVEFTDEMVQQMLDGGATQEEINQQEQIANDSAQQTIGLEKTCKFSTGDLTAMLNRWKEGNLSTEDWNVAECEGDY
jgi:hypothetical protein